MHPFPSVPIRPQEVSCRLLANEPQPEYPALSEFETMMTCKGAQLRVRDVSALQVVRKAHQEQMLQPQQVPLVTGHHQAVGSQERWYEARIPKPVRQRNTAT
jgi:hypothetical protein